MVSSTVKRQVKIQEHTLEDLIGNQDLTPASLRALLYLFSVMNVGETRHIILSDMTKKARLCENSVASKCLAALEKLGYINKWRKGNDLFVNLLVG
jgi:uncharacterized membrane protein